MSNHVSRLFALGIACYGVSLTEANALDWPQWRGPDRNDVQKETGLLKKWPEGGPKRAWLYNSAGNGYSGFSVVGGKLFTMGTRDENEILICLEAATGKELWAAPIGSRYSNKWGDGPRGTPTVDGDRIYALGAQGSLICAQAGDGKVLWQKSMKDLGGKAPGWGYCESPLVDGKQVVVTPGGDQGTVAALDKMTGEPLWQSKDITEGAQYSSIIPATIHGEKQYVQLVMQTLFAVSAADGKLLWRTPWPGRTAVIPTPIVRGDDVFVTSGYGAGCKLVRITPNNEVTDIYMNKSLTNHHGGVVLLGDHVYGHSDKEGWTCLDWKTGEVKWVDKTLGKGAIACNDGQLYLLEENNGIVLLIDATPDGWQEKGRFTLDPQSQIRSSSGHIWTHPVISGGKLYLRDQDLIYCFDLKG